MNANTNGITLPLRIRIFLNKVAIVLCFTFNTNFDVCSVVEQCRMTDAACIVLFGCTNQCKCLSEFNLTFSFPCHKLERFFSKVSILAYSQYGISMRLILCLSQYSRNAASRFWVSSSFCLPPK